RARRCEEKIMNHSRMRNRVGGGRLGALVFTVLLGLGAYGCATDVGDEVDLEDIEELEDGDGLGPDVDTASEFCADGTFYVTLEVPCPPWTGGGTRTCTDTCVVDRHLAFVNGEVVCVTADEECTRQCEPCHGAP